MSPYEQTRFMFISTVLIIITQTLSIHAIRHQKQNLILSLPLRSHNPKINNHTSSIMSRFKADTVRANYLNHILKNALFKSKSGFKAEKIQAPVTRLGGGYIASIGVGQRATESTLLIDTGSEIVWLNCPAKSPSYQTISCTAPQCNADKRWIGCNRDTGTCAFKVSYTDGSTTDGDYGIETLSFGSSDSVKNLAIGCANGEKVDDYDGILGLGPNSVSLPNQLKATSFSYCMVSSTSESTSGTLDFNSAAPSDSITVSMVRNPKVDLYYYVELAGITVGTDKIQIPEKVYKIGSDGRGGVILDSGTTYNLLDRQVYDLVLESFKKNTQDWESSPAPAGSGSEACYSIPSGSTVQVPAMSFQFSDGQSLELAPENYLIKKSESIFCLAFQPKNPKMITSIIGNVSQKGMRVTYDLVNNKIGFSPNKC